MRPDDIAHERLQALANLISAAGAAALVPNGEEILGTASVKQARLFNRFRRLQGEKWARMLNDGGVRAVAMKGLATAFTFWPGPDCRAVSDADLLVRPQDLEAALEFLKARGFAVANAPTRGPWGFVGDASFQPLIGPDDNSNIDLHIQGDSWPFIRALSVDEILGSAQETCDAGLWVPAPTHQFLIAASHAAGDLFVADAIKSVVDGCLMLRDPATIDFAELLSRSRNGLLLRSVTVFLSLLQRLGADCGPARDAGFRLDLVAGGEFESVVSAHNCFFTDSLVMGALARLRREAMLCTEPRVALWRNSRRLTGLVRPRKGSPEDAGT